MHRSMNCVARLHFFYPFDVSPSGSITIGQTLPDRDGSREEGIRSGEGSWVGVGAGVGWG